MEGLSPLTVARAVGLTIDREGMDLLITGPPSGEPIVQCLAAHKAEVLEVLHLQDQWKAEIAEMRRGDNPDWRSWSPACRSKWAEAWLDLAEVNGIQPTDDEKSWLAEVIEAGQRERRK